MLFHKRFSHSFFSFIEIKVYFKNKQTKTKTPNTQTKNPHQNYREVWESMDISLHTQHWNLKPHIEEQLRVGFTHIFLCVEFEILHVEQFELKKLNHYT